MQKHRAQSIGDIIAEYLHGSVLETPLLERRVMELWPQVLGPSVAQLTGTMEVKNGVLFVHIRSAALRAQLFECRHEVVRKLNDAARAHVLKDIRLLG